MPVQTHQIGLQGVTGGLFWTIMIGFIFYVLGFATVGWAKDGSAWYGLWSACSSYHDIPSWFKATQALITIGLILLIGCLITIFLYMFVHSLSLRKTELIQAFTVLAFLAVICMVIGFGIIGSKYKDKLSYSFALSVIGAVFCLIAAILAIVQMKQSNVIEARSSQ